MTEVVFWDTVALIVLADRDDALHSQAAQVSQRLAQRRSLILTTSTVLTEVINAFSKPKGRFLASRVVDLVDDSVLAGSAEVVQIYEELWRDGLLLFRERPDRYWSLTDCISFVVMRNLSIEKNFTADHHFTQAVFEILLTAATSS